MANFAFKAQATLILGALIVLPTVCSLPARGHQFEQPDRIREYRYAVVQIPGLGSGFDVAFGINDLGHVVGQSITPDLSEIHAFFWDGKVTHDLGTFGGNQSHALDVNNHDWVVGAAKEPEPSQGHAFLWKAGGDLIALEEFDGARYSSAQAINDSNVIAGNSHSGATDSGHACIWIGEEIVDLGTLGGPELDSIAFDINDKGFVTGWSGMNQGGRFTFLWDGNEMIHLGSLGDGMQMSEPRAINEMGDIVGFGDVNRRNKDRPFAYHNGMWTNLLRAITDRGFNGGFATDINNRGQIIGRVDHEGLERNFAFIWESGYGIQILNDLVPPNLRWDIKDCDAINEHGQIAAWADPIADPSLLHSLLLTPIDPELSLEIPDGPLQADANNTLKITNAQPGATIKFFYGKRGGGKRVPGCDALAAMLQIDDPVRFGEAIADADGNATLDIFAPAKAASHKGFLIQAVDFTNCEESQLVLKKVE